ncbi:hypothetical protein K466DRAFT_463195, partial [Polyporus arcularius HHB13444]
ILDGLRVEFTLVRTSVEVVLPETSKDFFDVLPVIGGQVREDVVDKTLKGCRSIGKSERHDAPLEQTIASPEGSLPFISGSDAD